VTGTLTPVRVVVAEDEVLVREGIRQLFESVDSIEVVEAVEDLTSLWAAVEAHDPDVVVTVVPMAPTFTDEGIRFAVELRQLRPEIAVVVLGDDVEEGYATALFEGGAGGRAYFLKHRVVDGPAFAETVRAVACGGSHVDVQVVEHLFAAANGGPASTSANLTPREREILGLMAEGRSNSAIARMLAVSNRAVERHVGSIFRKLDVDDSPDSSRRVLAVLAYLKDHNGSLPRLHRAV
jgi:DNA-binding NarL/FixJ family response regulator